MIIEVHFEGTIYSIEDVEIVCNQILQDDKFARRYLQSSTQQVRLCKQIQYNLMIVIVSSWDHKSTLLFLEECRKRKDDLRNNKIRRRTVFEDIAKILKEHGILYDTNTLDKKLKNLKIRYNIISDNNKKSSTGRGRMSWPYYDIMSDILRRGSCEGHGNH